MTNIIHSLDMCLMCFWKALHEILGLVGFTKFCLLFKRLLTKCLGSSRSTVGTVSFDKIMRLFATNSFPLLSVRLHCTYISTKILDDPNLLASDDNFFLRDYLASSQLIRRR